MGPARRRGPCYMAASCTVLQTLLLGQQLHILGANFGHLRSNHKLAVALQMIRQIGRGKAATSGNQCVASETISYGPYVTPGVWGGGGNLSNCPRTLSVHQPVWGSGSSNPGGSPLQGSNCWGQTAAAASRGVQRPTCSDGAHPRSLCPKPNCILATKQTAEACGGPCFVAACLPGTVTGYG